MAPFTTTTPHPLPHPLHLLQNCLLIQSKMTPKCLPLHPPKCNEIPLFPKPSAMSTKIYILRLMCSVLKRLSDFFGPMFFFFNCLGRKLVMKMKEKSNAKALGRPESGGAVLELKESLTNTMIEIDEGDSSVIDRKEDWDLRTNKQNLEERVDGDLETNDPLMNTMMLMEEEELTIWEEEEDEDLEAKTPNMKEMNEDSLVVVWDEEEEEGQEESDEESEEEKEDEDNKDCQSEDLVSDWSDDEGDSEASGESLELWESFLNTNDPYNPLSFCSSIGSRTKVNQEPVKTLPIETKHTADFKPEEEKAQPHAENNGKKVHFSEEVSVRPLLVWSFASQKARDGSCWLQAARDRERFRRRVSEMESLLNPCLTPAHRDQVWRRLQSQQPLVTSSSS